MTFSLSLSIDPNSRGQAYITSCGVQGTFMNLGDMYALALRKASFDTNGAIEYIQKDGTVWEVPNHFDVAKNHSEVLHCNESRRIYARMGMIQEELYGSKNEIIRLKRIINCYAEIISAIQKGTA